MAEWDIGARVPRVITIGKGETSVIEAFLSWH